MNAYRRESEEPKNAYADVGTLVLVFGSFTAFGVCLGLLIGYFLWRV